MYSLLVHTNPDVKRRIRSITRHKSIVGCAFLILKKSVRKTDACFILIVFCACAHAYVRVCVCFLLSLSHSVMGLSAICGCDISWSYSEIKKEGKDQESIQSSTTSDPGYQWESDNVAIRHHKREPRDQPFPSR